MKLSEVDCFVHILILDDYRHEVWLLSVSLNLRFDVINACSSQQFMFFFYYYCFVLGCFWYLSERALNGAVFNKGTVYCCWKTSFSGESDLGSIFLLHNHLGPWHHSQHSDLNVRLQIHFYFIVCIF